VTFEPLVLGAVVAAAAAVCLAFSALWSSRKSAVVELAGFRWTRADFCRGWLITGDTGSGKTRSGITPLLFQVFKNEPGGAASASTIRASTGRRFRRWPATSGVKTTSSCSKSGLTARRRPGNRSTHTT
jgi:hypothetical protein